MARVVGRAAVAVVGKVFLIVGLSGLVVAGALAAYRWTTIRSRVRADGTVVALSRWGRGYHPVTEFTPPGGTPVRIESTVSSNPPSYAVGDHVWVLYDPASPQQADIDRFWPLWFFPMLAGMLGTPFTLLGIIFSLVGRGARQVS
jgi:hypothetical protein